MPPPLNPHKYVVGDILRYIGINTHGKESGVYPLFTDDSIIEVVNTDHDYPRVIALFGAVHPDNNEPSTEDYFYEANVDCYPLNFDYDVVEPLEKQP